MNKRHYQMMAAQRAGSILVCCFGPEKDGGAAFFFSVIGAMGVMVCLLFRWNRHIWKIENP